jgi:hypothetical protein
VDPITITKANNMSRSYAVIKPAFWLGETAKAFRGNHAAQAIIFYVMSCKDSRMTGLYFLGLSTICRELGMDAGVARETLLALERHGFLMYDFDDEVIWVPNMAHHQVGDRMAPGDTRRASVLRQLEDLRTHPFTIEFYGKYGKSFSLDDPSYAPPHAPSYGAPHGAPHDPCNGSLISDPCSLISDPDLIATAGSSKSHTRRGARIDPNWEPTAKTVQWCQAKGVDHQAYLEQFKLFWEAKAGAQGLKLDWQKTFQTWILNDLNRFGRRPAAPASPSPKPPAKEIPPPPKPTSFDEGALDLFLRDS